MTVQKEQITAGAALLSRLKLLGVDYIFANSGTDFPPIIEGLSEADAKGMPLPKAVVMPFESAAVAMAHGYFLATGQPQAVMVHTNVGLANTAMGVINAACDKVPMLLIGGRTPTLEKGRLGVRSVPIGWGQEMLDQTSLVREACKWDYELRFSEQVTDVMDRAYGIATSTPKGPVYVSLPREVLCEVVPAAASERRPQMAQAVTTALSSDINNAALLLAEAKNPVIFAQQGAGNALAFKALGEMALEWGIPVCQYWAVKLGLPTNHPMSTGPDPKPLLEKADVILVIDSLAPWCPNTGEPTDACQVIQMGPEPLQPRSGVRNFRSDLSLPGETAPVLLALKDALDALKADKEDRNTARRKIIAQENSKNQAERFGATARHPDTPKPNKAWVSNALSEALVGKDAAVFSELGCQLHSMQLDHPDAWFESPHSGGLGWGFPAALGYKLANPDRPVVATMGDGSYIFANPVACHQIAESQGISIVLVVLNNNEWGAVRQSVLDIYPNGYASRANSVPLTGLDPSPDFVKVGQASRAWGRHVTSADQFEAAMADALMHTEQNKGLAIIEVSIA